MLSPFFGHKQQKNSHITPPQTHIAFIMTRPKGIASHQKKEQGTIREGKKVTPRDNRCFNRKENHSKINELSSLVINVTPLLNDSAINPPQLSSVHEINPYLHKTQRQSFKLI